MIGDCPFLYSHSSTLTYFRILSSWEFPIKSIYVFGYVLRLPFSLAEILQTLTSLMNNFLQLDAVPGVKSVKLSNVSMLVAGHLENCVLVSKREKWIAKRTCFWNLSVNVLLKIWNLLLYLRQTWHDCVWSHKEVFQPFWLAAGRKFSVLSVF